MASLCMACKSETAPPSYHYFTRLVKSLATYICSRACEKSTYQFELGCHCSWVGSMAQKPRIISLLPISSDSLVRHSAVNMIQSTKPQDSIRLYLLNPEVPFPIFNWAFKNLAVWSEAWKPSDSDEVSFSRRIENAHVISNVVAENAVGSHSSARNL
ncbi:uncharacterized protein EAF02_010874 [Botrytis sinoallii]|uniref:uncharacterized protein n=1 Tax=Botrytis sinoallii TaxID=1463999 RepID=UPI001902464F|nr:uncharacterized protein EAF02_010874 [Botrytis sinoallii]KAF7859426.1 hypothetical protein EAF02_010874 [Botrytis sinoallii]